MPYPRRKPRDTTTTTTTNEQVPTIKVNLKGRLKSKLGRTKRARSRKDKLIEPEQAEVRSRPRHKHHHHRCRFSSFPPYLCFPMSQVHVVPDLAYDASGTPSPTLERSDSDLSTSSTINPWDTPFFTGKPLVRIQEPEVDPCPRLPGESTRDYALRFFFTELWPQRVYYFKLAGWKIKLEWDEHSGRFYDIVLEPPIKVVLAGTGLFILLPLALFALEMGWIHRIPKGKDTKDWPRFLFMHHESVYGWGL